MNYEPNTVRWNPGDLVLHDCDAKNAHMLMRVVKYLPDGTVRAEYLDADKRKGQMRRAREWRRESGWFDLCDLHDPKRFEVTTVAAL